MRIPSNKSTVARLPGADLRRRLILLSLAAASVWMFVFVYRYSVNLFYYDSWDILPEILNGKSWLELFALQFGPHRMGAGIWLTKITMSLSHWDARAECYVIAFFMVSSCALALILKNTLIRSWSFWDILLVSHFLSLASWESLVGTAQLSFGAVPLFLILAAALALSISDPRKRIALLIPLSVGLAFTCHGQLAVPFIFGSILLDGVFTKDWRIRLWAAAGVAFILLMCTYLLVTYQTGMEGTDCLVNSKGLASYLMFAGAYTMSALGWYMYVPGFPILGAILFLCLGALWAFLAVKVTKGGSRDPLLRVVVYLVGFTLLHTALCSYGRACLGARAGYTSRYFVYMLPGYVGLYLWVQSLQTARLRNAILSVMLAGHLSLQIFLYFHQLPKVARDMEGRRRILACLVKGNSIGDCEREAGHRIHPSSTETGIPEELERFKRLGISIYRQ